MICLIAIQHWPFLFSFLFEFVSLRGFLSIDVDVSELYINQCDMNNNQFYSENHYSNYRNNKFSSNHEHQHQFPMNSHSVHQLTPLQPSSTFHLDNEIEAFHGSHKCHRDSMDVSDVLKHFNWIFPLKVWSLFVLPAFTRRLSHLIPSSVNFVHNTWITIDYRQLTAGQEAHINVCVNKDFTRFDTRADSMGRSWKLLSMSISITRAHSMSIRFCACHAWKAVQAARDRRLVWLNTTGVLGLFVRSRTK